MGFEIERFIDDVNEEFICPICSGVLEDPLQATDCEHAFCRACITEWISRQPTCPVDRQPVTTSLLGPVPRLIRNVLSRLNTSCDYALQGCNAVLQLESLASHLVECEFNPKRPVPCEAGCGLVIPKDELAEHNCVQELRALIATHQEKLNNYKQELAENKKVHQEKLNEYKQELAENKRVHQEKLNEYKQELAENKRVHQEKLNDYEQELAKLKRELASLNINRKTIHKVVNNNSPAFYVVQFIELPFEGIADYVCVPLTWVIARKSLNQRSIVAYPVEEDPFVTRDRAKSRERCNDEWRYYMAFVKYETDSYNDAEYWIATRNDCGPSVEK